MTWCNFPMNGNYHEPSVDWFINTIKNAIDEWDKTKEQWDSTEDFINNYFNNLDLQTEINNKINDMIDTGQFQDILRSVLSTNFNRNYILISDSYGLSTENWESWETFFSQMIDGKCYNSAVGGSGFIGDTSVHNFVQQLENTLNSIDNKYEITDIVVLGGYNDASTNQNINDILSNMKNFDTMAKKNCPGAKIHLGFIAIDSVNDGMMNKLLTYRDYYKLNAIALGWDWITNIYYSLYYRDNIFISSGNPNSGFHPSTDGNKFIARNLKEYLYSGNLDVIFGEVFQGMTVYFKNGDLKISPQSGSLLYPIPAGDYEFNRWYPLASLDNSKLLWGVQVSPNQFINTMTWVDTTGKNLGFLKIQFLNKQLQIQNFLNTNTIHTTNESFCISDGFIITEQLMY